LVVHFDWDPDKDQDNQRKHDISFAEASELFASDDYLEIFDAEHSEEEERFIAIGLILRGVIVVVWTQRDADTVRIISARKATTREIELYREYMGEQS
jgi:uncharacterized DUF497 family protein